MTVDYGAIRDALVSLAQSTGDFDAVQGHEPKNAPGIGLFASVRSASVTAIRAGGLNSTSVRLAWVIEVRCNMTREPQDSIDIDCLAAVDRICAEINGDFDLDIEGVRNIDVLGAYGDPLMVEAGYVEHDSTMYRIFDITVPVIVNDAWTQVK